MLATKHDKMLFKLLSSRQYNDKQDKGCVEAYARYMQDKYSIKLASLHLSALSSHSTDKWCRAQNT